MKLKAFNKNRVGKYLLYALGEIILVVAGILIALNINTASEQKKNNDRFNSILASVASDLKLDTLNVGKVIKNYEDRKKFLNPIIKGTFTDEQFKTCLMCGPIITTFAPININDKGYLQLKNFYNNTEGTDTLSTKIVQFYTRYTKTINELESEVKINTLATVKHWRDTYPWFANTRSNQRDDRYLAYLQSEEYRNYVAYFSLIANNFTLILRRYNADATKILETIEALQKETKL